MLSLNTFYIQKQAQMSGGMSSLVIARRCIEKLKFLLKIPRPLTYVFLVLMISETITRDKYFRAQYDSVGHYKQIS